MLYRSRSTYVLQGTAKKAKEEKAQGFGRKLDAEKIIGATNEPGFVFLLHVLYTLPILFGSSPAYMAKLPINRFGQASCSSWSSGKELRRLTLCLPKRRTWRSPRLLSFKSMILLLNSHEHLHESILPGVFAQVVIKFYEDRLNWHEETDGTGDLWGGQGRLQQEFRQSLMAHHVTRPDCHVSAGFLNWT